MCNDRARRISLYTDFCGLYSLADVLKYILLRARTKKIATPDPIRVLLRIITSFYGYADCKSMAQVPPRMSFTRRLRNYSRRNRFAIVAFCLRNYFEMCVDHREIRDQTPR